MPRYFFDVRRGRDLRRDVHGRELAGLAAARRDAVQLSLDLADQRRDWDGWRISVRNDRDQELFSIPICEDDGPVSAVAGRRPR
jgi:hypothetical protein